MYTQRNVIEYKQFFEKKHMFYRSILFLISFVFLATLAMNLKESDVAQIEQHMRKLIAQQREADQEIAQLKQERDELTLKTKKFTEIKQAYEQMVERAYDEHAEIQDCECSIF